MHVFHHEVVAAVGLPELLDAHHVRVVDARGELRLVDEHPAKPLVLREVIVNDLDRDGS